MSIRESRYKADLWKVMVVWCAVWGVTGDVLGDSTHVYALRSEKRFIRKIGLEVRPGYIFPENPFLRGENEKRKPIDRARSEHLKYAFQSQPNTMSDRIFGGAYQGAGIAFYRFGEKKTLGDPVVLYLFQGARIARLHARLSLNYEWNFGLSAGWKPHDYDFNPYNTIIGSKMNAYLDAGLALNWMLSRRLDLISGITLTHFSNGNTRFPNAGLNMAGLKVGLAYLFNRQDGLQSKAAFETPVPAFPRHMAYDLVLFGSWRRKGVPYVDNQMLASPDTYPVFGFNFAPMYHTGYRFRMGLSLDGYYDGSANLSLADPATGMDPPFVKPSPRDQLALGVSARTEYVMPYFSVNVGVGFNLLHGRGDLKAFYQILALKMEVTRNSFLHFGYSLHNFNTPNFLMLGIGFRFHNKYPVLQK
jgi:hypothetical protein